MPSSYQKYHVPEEERTTEVGGGDRRVDPIKTHHVQEKIYHSKTYYFVQLTYTNIK